MGRAPGQRAKSPRQVGAAEPDANAQQHTEPMVVAVSTHELPVFGKHAGIAVGAVRQGSQSQLEHHDGRGVESHEHTEIQRQNEAPLQ